jgi:hypothetical protein
MEFEEVKISNDTVLQNEQVTIHIDYTAPLTLKELSEILDLTTKAINNVNRASGMKNNSKLGTEYAPEVSGVESGSIVIHILTNFFAPIALSMMANYLYDKLKCIGAKKENGKINLDTAYPISINVNGNDNLIELHIMKPIEGENP